MSRLNLRSLGLAAAALIAAGVAGTAQIERLTLDQMVAKTDNSVGEITKKEVIRIDHPIDGPELYFTHLTVEGRSLVDGKKMTAVVTYPGGFIDDENGVWNSEAPSDEDTKLGNQVVVFFKHTKNLGGDLEADALYASHGGLFRTAKSQSGTVVLGRGEGYAISDNTQLSVLDESVTELHQAQQDARK